MFKIKHSSSKSAIHFAHLPRGVAENSEQAENWGLDRPSTHRAILPTHLLENMSCFSASNLQEKLFVVVVLVFCQLSAPKWLSNPLTKGGGDRVWPER